MEVIELTSPDCSYNVHKWLPNDEKYTCFVKNQIIEPGKTLQFPKFNVLFMDLKKGVRALEFSDCKLFEIPSRLTATFAYLEILSIRNCFLKTITRIELSEFKHLKQLFIVSNEISHLSADVFTDLHQLEAFSFYQNKISSIEPGIFSSLRDNLKYVDFRQNTRINACFAITPYSHPAGEYYTKINSLNNLIAIIEMHCTGQEKTKRVKGSGLAEDIKRFIADDKFKDFTVTVADGNDFKVHKFLITARSSVMAAMLQDKPDARDLKLNDLTSEIFQILLDFMYSENFPVDEDINLVEVYKAAGQLEINELKDFCAEELIDKVNDDNSLELLLLSNKYGNHDLKMKAFDEIKKSFPDKKFKDELADDPETIKKMLFVKKKLEFEFEALGVYE